MPLTTWIVTEVYEDDPQASIHFVVATSADRAKDLVTRRTLIPGNSLSAVPLSHSPVSYNPRKELALEKYLGPLEKFSPVLRADCSFCHGIGLIPGSKPVEMCPTCGGSGFKTVARN